MTFDFAQMVAVDYWAKRNVTVPCHPREKLLTWDETRSWLDDPASAPDMLADVPTCTVDVTPWAEDSRTVRETASNYCWEITHEVGHLAGLEHVHDGSTVMDPDGAPYPYGCTHPKRFLRTRRDAVRLARTSRLEPLP